MTAEIVPLNFHAECVNKVVSWADDLRDMLAANKIAALVVRGIDTDGEVIAWTITPDKAPTLRYMLIGQLHEAAHELAAEPCLMDDEDEA